MASIEGYELNCDVRIGRGNFTHAVTCILTQTATGWVAKTTMSPLGPDGKVPTC